MVLQRVIVAMMIFVSVISAAVAAPVSQYLPSGQNYLASVPTPESVLGFGIGERHPRHDQLVAYFRQLAQKSARVQLTTMGLTSEFRPQLLATISSPANLAKLEQLLDQRDSHQQEVIDGPNVIWLGYSVHGDEISGANAAMVIAYHLAASDAPEVKALLEHTVIAIEPSINPDGMDRFVNWVNTFRGSTANPDPNHIEHHQNWFTGRTNHFAFDLNRDWLLLSQQETRNRMPYYHRYQPNVLSDFHEMGADSTFFFQPGIPSRTNPLTPKANIDLTGALAQYHAQMLDANQRLYFTQESYDDFYYGKGSTYPDINGGVGILFEQASSRGYQQNTDNGLLTFEFAIQNQVYASLSTLQGAWQNRQRLAQYRADFYKQSEKLAKKEDFSGYLLRESKDHYRLQALLQKLRQHQIKVYQLAQDFRLNGEIYPQQSSYYVPLAQPQYRVIKALFEQVTEFKDNTFYDVSGWTMPLAMNIEYHQVDRTWGLKLAASPWQAEQAAWQAPEREAYAYVFEWYDFLAPKLLHQLLSHQIKARVATKAFTATVAGKAREFAPGSIVVPAGIQNSSSWQASLFKAAKENNIALFALNSGLTGAGVDVGSRSLLALTDAKVLLVGGKGVSQHEAGELLFYLDDTLHIPVTVVEQQRLSTVDFSRYSHILMVDGDYQNLPPKTEAQLGHWLKQGGVLFAQKRAAKWLSEHGLLKVDFVRKSQLQQLFSSDGLTYQDKESFAAKQRIAGAIFASTLDTSNPLAYGYQRSDLPVFSNSTLIMESPSQPFVTVAKYTASPLLSGYSDENLLSTLANSPVLVAHNVGQGRVIATSDVFAFRGYWYGSAKLIANALFFAKALDVPMNTAE